MHKMNDLSHWELDVSAQLKVPDLNQGEFLEVPRETSWKSGTCWGANFPLDIYLPKLVLFLLCFLPKEDLEP